MSPYKISSNKLRVGKRVINGVEFRKTTAWSVIIPLLQDYLDKFKTDKDSAIQELNNHLIIQYSGSDNYDSIKNLELTSPVIDQIISLDELSIDSSSDGYDLLCELFDELIVMINHDIDWN